MSDWKFRSFEKANDNKHKFVVALQNMKTMKAKYIKFGAKGMDDFTITKNEEQKERYIARHKKNENWNDPTTAGFWSKNVLWNKPTIHKSLWETINKYKL